MTSPHPSMTSPHPGSMGPSPSPRGPGGEASHLYSGPSSAIAPSPQQQYQHGNNDDNQQQSQNPQMMSPAHLGMQMKSPMMPTSNLRKIRRPSKPKGEAGDEYMGDSGKQINDSGPGSLEIKKEPQTPSTPHPYKFQPKDESSNDIKSESSFDFKEEVKQ